jgi:hypothetical protein
LLIAMLYVVRCFVLPSSLAASRQPPGAGEGREDNALVFVNFRALFLKPETGPYLEHAAQFGAVASRAPGI